MNADARLSAHAPIVKVCACGRSYTAKEWQELARCGLWKDSVEVLVLRHCHCGSTIAVVLWSTE